MLIFILTDVHYSKNAVFSFEKGLNCQILLLRFPSPGKKIPPVMGGIYPSTPYHYLENPTSMGQIFCQLKKALLLRICQAFSQK